jgi:hypothetical protein
MGLPRTFVSFSGTDIRSYRMMQAWKENKRIDFNFVDVQLEQEINSENEAYIKAKCRERIGLAGTFAILIGQDTRYKYKYVRWEAEVALEKKCRIIGINLDGSRRYVEATCPPIIRDVGAMFVPFRARILAHALQDFERKTDDNWHYPDTVYTKLGY